VFLVAAALGWIVHRARVQRDAVAAIERCGGYVEYDWQLLPGRLKDPGRWHYGPPPHRPGTGPPWPRWLVDMVGIDELETVKKVDVGKQSPDAILPQVGQLGRLEQLTSCWGRSITDAGVAQLRALKELRALVLYGRFTGKSLANLSELTHLKSLRLEIIDFAGPTATADLSPLRLMTDMRDLALSSSKLTTVDLALLRDMHRLELLDLHNIGVTDLHPIQHLSKIYRLGVSGSPLGDAGLAPVGVKQSFPKLEILALANTRITDAGLKPLRNLPRLRDLDLEGTQITDAGTTTLGALPRLYSLNLARTPITDDGLIDLKNLTALRILTISSTRVTDTGMLHLTNLSGLVGLYLNSTRITDLGLEHLVKLPQIRSLDLSSTQVTDAGLEHIGRLPQLDDLSLSSTRITDLGMVVLGKLPALAVLDLSETLITDAGLKHLANLPELVTLDLSRTRVTDAGFRFLNGMQERSSLNLTGTCVTDAGVEAFQKGHPTVQVER
jgi:Leucine-rich repeat (LRR) protein